MTKYTKAFDRYWRNTDNSAFGNVPFHMQETIKRTAWKAWQARARARVPIRKSRPGVPF